MILLGDTAVGKSKLVERFLMVREYEEEITSLVNAREAEISRIQGFVASATKELVRAKESEEKTTQRTHVLATQKL